MSGYFYTIHRVRAGRVLRSEQNRRMEMRRFVLSLDPASLCLRRVIDSEVEACHALPDFMPTLTGGDGDGMQFCEHRFNLSHSPRLFIEHNEQF